MCLFIVLNIYRAGTYAQIQNASVVLITSTMFPLYVSPTAAEVCSQDILGKKYYSIHFHLE
jgi:hypothetical protein